jgi:lipopolysaccharide export LptBFGC system permease protein LptF
MDTNRTPRHVTGIAVFVAAILLVIFLTGIIFTLHWLSVKVHPPSGMIQPPGTIALAVAPSEMGL